ncbi:MAG TPA: AGE family epimerase/isomerase [Steroidobacteraceae bacterium]|jgi:mannose/cellobiose epimerase-like protein (N-acyl-D-glucosamine 2-epimerase family)|nr:AGE family epimerase/isomerase [Steroidobacteraceae bacterium]
MNTISSLPQARQMHGRLLTWLIDDAYPVWATAGFDAVHRAFHERLLPGGALGDEPRRARVQTRQVYAYARAAQLGWRGDARTLVEAGLSFFTRHYLRADGLFHTLVAPDGKVRDDRAALYDQAFALLALASAQQALGAAPQIVALGTELRTRVRERLHRPGGGFDSGIPERLPLLSNPHMHLLEAALAWKRVSSDPAWADLADEICALALKHFIDPKSGALAELFDEHWQPLPDATPGQAIEPGHQFEWAWLLLCQDETSGSATRMAAERLFDIGENHGVKGGIAINALKEDFRIKDPAARLWPQTERLKAAARLGALSGQERYWSSALGAAQGLWRFLDHGARGLWHDKIDREGKFVIEPAPASSFYHIICAIAEFGEALQQVA